MNGSNYIKFPLRSSAIFNFEKDDNFCFLWLILAKLHACKNIHPNRVSNYTQHSNEIKIQDFDCAYGFSVSDVRRLGNLKKLSINIIELNFYQDQKKFETKIKTH